MNVARLTPLFALPLLTAACAWIGCSSSSPAGSGGGGGATTTTTTPPADLGSVEPYDIGSPALAELWVDPLAGNDARSGATEGEALRTLTAAWAKLPASTASAATGYRVNLKPGAYPCEPGPEADNCINYFEARHGTRERPLILRATGGRGTVTLRGGLNLRDVAYLYLLDVDLVGGGALPTNSSGNNLLHLEAGDHVLLRGVTVTGPACVTDACNNLQEVLKVNQTQHLYVEECTLGGAWHSTVDYMVVQHSHVLRSHLRGAGQWCMYIKGGSAYVTIADSELEGCQLGFQAGQAANLAMMRSPWLHHEAYDVRFVNNVVHDVPGVPLSVAGAYNALFAHNTLYRVATATEGYPLLQVVPGERNCTGTDELPDPATTCQARAAEGGWGPTGVSEGLPVIPARNTWFYNNVFYNPAGSQTAYTQLIVAGPTTLPAGVANLPATIAVDAGLVLAGNVIWNGPADHPLGLDEGSGCQPSHATCAPTAITSANTINAWEPRLAAPATGDYRPESGGALERAAGVPIPSFTWTDCPSPPAVPVGRLSNELPLTRSGAARGAARRPGAY